MFELPELGPNIFTGVLVSIIMVLLSYLWKILKEPVSHFLLDSILGDLVNWCLKKVREFLKIRLLMLEENELTDLVIRNPEVIESQFRVIETECRIFSDGYLIEPEILGKDQENRDTLVFIKNKFDVKKNRIWLDHIERHVVSDYRVIIAATTYPSGVKEAQDRGINQIYLQDNLFQLCLAFLTKFY